MSGTTHIRGPGGPPTRHQPGGHLEPILVDGLGQARGRSLGPSDGRSTLVRDPRRRRVGGHLDWLSQHAVPLHVPNALRRARSPQALDPELQTHAEASARRALNDLDADYTVERRRLEGELQQASAAAEPVRYGLLYGTGAELEKAVASVLEAAGFETVDLDNLLGDTDSADLLVTYERERRLVEVKSVRGRAAGALVGHLRRHLDT